jgi:predicted MPP superfamily phosphohydrolase
VYVANTDLLPPLFDQVLDYFEVNQSGPMVRQDIVQTLENGIVNAAAAAYRRRQLEELSDQPKGGERNIELRTSDRLSGTDISRAALALQLQNQTGLAATLMEIALLLVEAQIDLRLKGGDAFKISGIAFSHAADAAPEVTAEAAADWCRVILNTTLQSSGADRPTLWFAPWRKAKPAATRVLVETIQLSATLRTALPYIIRVDRHLIDGLLGNKRATRAVRLLHVSDLHIANQLSASGGRQLTPFGVPTHSFERARFVASAVRGLEPRYDLLIATGDLTAGGSRAAFESVLQYVQSGSITGENPSRIAAYGLGAAPTQRVLLPGNHDRYAGEPVLGQRLSTLFEEVLQTAPRGYPYVVGYRPPGDDNDPERLTLLFLVFDSTLPEGRKDLYPRSWAEAVAQGMIAPDEMTKALEQIKLIVNAGSVPRPDGGMIKFKPENTIRIALLHHHPVAPAEAVSQDAVPASTSFLAKVKDFFSGAESIERASTYDELMKMHNHDVFLRGCFACGVQLVLFGHQHKPYWRLIEAPPDAASPETPFGLASRYLRAFCCPTTLQYDAPGYGFYVFDFLSATEIEWSMFGWTMKKDESATAGPLQRLDSRIYDLSAEPTKEEVLRAYRVASG